MGQDCRALSAVARRPRIMVEEFFRLSDRDAPMKRPVVLPVARSKRSQEMAEQPIGSRTMSPH